MTVEIDSNSGFCGGVIRAISGAEKVLSERGSLWSLGAIVHNEAELSRLERLGLRTIELSQLEGLSVPEGIGPGRHATLGNVRGGDPSEMGGMRGAAPNRIGTDAFPNGRPVLLIRAHGEPPQTYRLAEERGFEVVDFTCPVVLKIQKSIREAWQRSRPDGQIVIFGKVGHAEVLGLVGQVDGRAVVVENLAQIEAAVADGRIDTSRPVDIFSQTTKSPAGYGQVCAFLAEKMQREGLLTVHNTICTQVASRYEKLSGFAGSHDAVVFVSGGESSNGKVLCELCRNVNPRTFHVGAASEVKPEWFRPGDRVGVCGATSTPGWLLEQVAEHIKNLQ